MGGCLTRRLAQTSGLPAAPNPAFSRTRLLAGMNGTNGSTTIPDESSNISGNAIVAGNAQLDTSIKQFGTASLVLDGTGDLISWADAGAWDLGSTDDFQLELWVRWAAGASFAVTYTFMSQWTASGNQRAYRLGLDNDGLLKFQYTTAGITAVTAVSVAWTPATQTWYHVAYSRVAGVSRLFVDGALLATSGASNFDPQGVAAPFRIGGQESGGIIVNLFTGNIDEVRFCKLVGGGSSGEFYTAAFAPITGEFPRS